MLSDLVISEGHLWVADFWAMIKLPGNAKKRERRWIQAVWIAGCFFWDLNSRSKVLLNAAFRTPKLLNSLVNLLKIWVIL